ncbi:MAG: energy-coupling factor ABC transporter ATP-binding protein [Candidatus Fervidibacter sp.]|uniref:energy-coupling factor ABC transporter ATP-binding protein n=1 Tax=Candidatus Fervidibacter sp. TaxID=3100871 RepID=UPI0040493CB3
MCEAIRVENLHYRYPDGTHALKGVSFLVEEGESVALIGPNGAGKTTLLLHLNGILQGEGKVFIFGEEVTKQNLLKIRRLVGLVFQDPDDQLFMPTILEDVAFGPLNLGLSKDEALKRALKALELVGMSHAATRSPHQLSFGERKRVAIATVLAMEPKILVLDEPTANLDPRSRRQLIALLKQLNITKIVATHDLDTTLLLCEKAILMDGGQIVTVGEIKKILSDDELMEAHGLEVPPTLLTFQLHSFRKGAL